MLVALMPLFDDAKGSMQLPIHLACMVFCYIALAQSWNILAGLCGQFSVGHAAFYGLGSYAVGIGLHRMKINLFLAILMGVVFSIIVAAILGVIGWKLSGFYYTMASIALAECLAVIASTWYELTSAQQGIAIYRPSIPKAVFMYMAMAIMIATIIIFYFIRKSKLGTTFVAVRENENLAQSLGANTGRYKMFAVLISGTMTSLIGSFMMYYVQAVDPMVFSSAISSKILIVAIIGGIGTIWGPIVGGLYVLLEEVMRGVFGSSFASLSVMIVGGILTFIMMVRPEGISAIPKVYKEWREQKQSNKLLKCEEK